MKTVAIIGAGSWGVALAIHISKLGNKVRLWSYNPSETELIRKERVCKFLPGVMIPEEVECYNEFEPVITGADYIFHVTPSRSVRETLRKYKNLVTDQPIILCSKGFEKDSMMTLDEEVEDELPKAKIGVLSGPTHAEEVSIGLPSALVIASKNNRLLQEVQTLLMSDTLRVYTSTDIKGAELGGALKNIVAFTAGIAYGLGLRDNSFAALITRGLAEITRLGVALGGQHDTFYGLTGLGDLIVTCLSEHSRNRRAGILIGEGKSLDEVKKEIGMTIESIDNLEVTYELSQIHGIEMPIVEKAYQILYEGLSCKEALTQLMNRGGKHE